MLISSKVGTLPPIQNKGRNFELRLAQRYFKAATLIMDRME